jgi:nicotinamidase-related amidase
MKALLVVDVQSGLVVRDLHEKDRFLASIKDAVEKARRNGLFIAAIQHTNKQLAENTESWRVYPGIGILSSDFAMEKNHGNAFEKTELKNVLAKQGIRDIMVCGLVSHGCVRATCLGGLEAGFGVSLLRHGHSCWNTDAEAKMDATEKELSKMGVKIEAMDEFAH